MEFWGKGRREGSGFDFSLIKKTLRINVDVDVDADGCFALFLVPRYLIYLYLGNGRS